VTEANQPRKRNLPRMVSYRKRVEARGEAELKGLRYNEGKLPGKEAGLANERDPRVDNLG